MAYKTQPTTTGKKKATDSPKREVAYKLHHRGRNETGVLSATKVVKKKSGEKKTKNVRVAKWAKKTGLNKPTKEYRGKDVKTGKWNVFSGKKKKNKKS